MGSARVTPSGQRLLAIIELQNAIAGVSMNADEVMQMVAERARLLTSANTGMVALVEGDELVSRASAPSGTVGVRLAKTGAIGKCVADRQPVRIDDVATADTDTRARFSTGAVACAPLFYGESVVGVIEVASAQPLTDEDIETLRLLAQIVAIARHRTYTYPRPRFDSQHDPLTGLGNRRAFDERLVAELVRNKRYGHSFSLAILTLADLETAIDRLGQAA